MTSVPESTLLRPGVLEGRVVVVAGRGGFGAAAGRACGALGARIDEVELTGDEEALAPRIAELDALHVLVIDAAGVFASGAEEPLRAALDGAWAVIRTAGTGAMIEAEGGGKIVLLAPPPGAGAHAEATRVALENLARTLSIEWARHDVRPTAILPGPETEDDEVGSLVAYLASEAGDYFSGCAFTLGSVVA